eukprot:2015756-Pyramimonas_sp.AAC.1
MHKQVFPPRALRRLYSPPPALAGRAGAVRLKTATLDVLFMVLYFPCQPQGRGQAATYRKT